MKMLCIAVMKHILFMSTGEKKGLPVEEKDFHWRGLGVNKTGLMTRI
ncbi:hypothetical protein [Paraflavitalea soli]|nr:hypothetical protein [Paraflavitalea soli]